MTRASIVSRLTIIAGEVGRGLADSAETVEDQDWLCSASPDCVRSAFSRRQSGDNDILLPGILWACEAILTYLPWCDDSSILLHVGHGEACGDIQLIGWPLDCQFSLLYRSRAKPLFNV